MMNTSISWFLIAVLVTAAKVQGQARSFKLNGQEIDPWAPQTHNFMLNGQHVDPWGAQDNNDDSRNRIGVVIDNDDDDDDATDTEISLGRARPANALSSNERSTASTYRGSSISSENSAFTPVQQTPQSVLDVQPRQNQQAYDTSLALRSMPIVGTPQGHRFVPTHVIAMNPGDNQRYQASNQGYGTSEQGYGGQGYGTPNQGYGTSEQGYGGQGYGIPNQGYGTPNQGYASANPGYGTSNQGYRPANRMYGITNQGYGSPNPSYHYKRNQ